MSQGPARDPPSGGGHDDSSEFDVFLKGAKHPHLSWSRVLEHRDRMHPRIVSTGDDGKARYRPVGCCQVSVGCHKPCPKACGTKADTGDFIAFGLGVALLFKFIKFVICLMLVLVVFALPPILLFATGDTDWRAEGTSTDATQLWRLTPANIGTSTGVCESAYVGPGSRVTLRCPAGTVMTSVTASFGLNAGECSCPAARLPDEEEQCPGKPRTDGSCKDGEFCQFARDRPLTLRAGFGVGTGPCCAPRLSRGAADFSDLSFRSVPGCDSTSAQRLAEAMCLRQGECTLAADADTPHIWPEADASGLGSRRCNGTERDMGVAALPAARAGSSQVVVAEGTDVSGTDVCAQTFRAFGGLDDRTCANPAADAGYAASYTYLAAVLDPNATSSSEPAPHARLLATATCSSLYVEIRGYLRIPKDSVAMVVMVCDILLLLSFLAAIGVLARREGEADDGVEVASPADYTVVIRSLPPHANVAELEASLRAHLKDYLDRCAEVVKPNERLGGHGCEVADINFGLDSEVLTELKVMHGDAAAELQRLVAEMRARGLTWREIRASPDFALLKEKGGGCAVRFAGGACLSCCGSTVLRLAYRIEAAKEHLQQTSQVVDQVRERDTTTKAIIAFVTFVEEEAAFRARAEFPNSTCYANCCLPATARLPYTDPQSRQAKTWPLRVQRAEEPADLIWENMRFATNREGRVRRACSGFITFLVLVMAFGAIYLLERQRILAARQYPTVDCSVFPNPSDKVSALTDERFERFGLSDGRSGRIQCYCTQLLLNSSGNVVTLFDEQFPVPSSPQVAAASSSEVLASDLARTQGGTAGVGPVSLTPPAGWTVERLCSSWVQSYAQVQLLTYGSAVAVLVLKSLVTIAIRFVVRHEKRTSQTEATLSRASKMFVSQFVVTAMLVVLINARINEAGVADIFIGEHTDFDAGWYKGPGTSIMLTMLLNVVFDAATPIRRVLTRKFARCRDRGCRLPPNALAKTRFTGKATQAELNDLYSGILMPMDELYASIVNQVFVCVTFCTGMPLLVPTACLFATTFFVVHKTLFSTSYRTPTSTSEILSRKMTAFLPMAAVIHAFLGAWMLSNPEVFPSTREVEAAASASGTASIDDAINGIGTFSSSAIDQLRGISFSGYNIGDRLAKAHVFPLFAIGVILLAVGVVRLTVGRAIFKFGKACLTACRCCCGCFLKPEDAGFENLKPYWDALPDSVLDDFPRAYRPKAALTDAYRRAKSRRRDAGNVSAKATKIVDTRLARLREARERLERTNDEVTRLASRVAHGDSSGNDQERLEELTGRLEAEAAELKRRQALVAAAHRKASRMRARAAIARRLSGVVDKDDEARLRAAMDDGDAPSGGASDGTAAKIISSSMVHSYDIDDNSSYVERFGFHVMRSIADADLLREVRAFMPRPHGRRESQRSKRSLSADARAALPAAIPEDRDEEEADDDADEAVADGEEEAEYAEGGAAVDEDDGAGRSERGAAEAGAAAAGHEVAGDYPDGRTRTGGAEAKVWPSAEPSSSASDQAASPDEVDLHQPRGHADLRGRAAPPAFAPEGTHHRAGAQGHAPPPLRAPQAGPHVYAAAPAGWGSPPASYAVPVSAPGHHLAPVSAAMMAPPPGQPVYVQTPQGLVLVSPYTGHPQPLFHGAPGSPATADGSPVAWSGSPQGAAPPAQAPHTGPHGVYPPHPQQS